MEQFKMDHKLEYVISLDLLARAINANRGFSISDIIDGERLWDAHNLANKFFDHAVTVLYLLHGTRVQIPSFEFRFVDSASIDVLTRATMEAFLVFHYVFFVPSEKEERDFRYWAYKAAGIAERQNLPESIFEHERQKAEEKIVLDELHDKLKLNAIFQGCLTDKQKRQILKGKWRLTSWREIAIDAGLSEMLASHMYRHLSGYAHSSSLSVLQTKQAVMNKGQEQLVQSSIATMNVFIANMIREYCGLFLKAQDVLDAEPAGNKEMIEVWIKIGRQLDENLDTGRDNE